MPKQYSRTQRVNDLLQTALVKILRDTADEMHLGMVTITHISVSHDLSFAKIFISVLDEAKAEDTVNSLNSVIKHIRYELAQKVKLRVMPELRFMYDDSIVRGHHISSLINHVLKDDSSTDE